MTKLKWTDNCDGSGEVTGTDKSAGSNPEVITRTWTYTDACGNKSTATQTITITEKSGIVFINPPSDAKYSCAGDVPEMKDLSWSENCGTTGFSKGVETRTGTCPMIIIRKWTATDGQNNTITHTQTITVSDKTAPVFTKVPADESYECLSGVPVLADLEWIDNCGTTGIAKGSQIITGSCPSIITRTWSAEDLCGNKVVYTQEITVTDKTDPVFEQQPADIKVMCKTAMPAMISLKWTDNCTGSGEVTGVDTQINKCLPVITRTWTYTDLCGNTASVSQQITLDNTSIPVFINPPSDKKYECLSEVPAIEDLEWTDYCGSTGIIKGTECKSGSCPTTIVRKWSVKDGLGNTVTHVQTIIVDDNTPPVFLFTPANASYEHSADVPAMTDLEWTDNCGETGFAKGTETISCTCPTIITRKWVAQDGCGNRTTYIQQITFTGDTGPTSVQNPILAMNLKAYPNPFKEVANFELEMPFKSRVRIEIFSLSGGLLKVVLDEDLEAGDFRKLEFSAGKYPYSSFLYRITTDYNTKSGIIIKMK